MMTATWMDVRTNSPSEGGSDCLPAHCIHTGLNVGTGLCFRSGVEEISIDLDNRHKFLLLERRITAFPSSNFPQAPKGMKTFIQMPDLGKRTTLG